MKAEKITDAAVTDVPADPVGSRVHPGDLPWAPVQNHKINAFQKYMVYIIYSPGKVKARIKNLVVYTSLLSLPESFSLISSMVDSPLSP